MRRWTLLLAGAALWLFLAAIPALADGGPHVAANNDGTGPAGLTADSCAGCHRAHTAQAEFQLIEDQATLCLVCHGSSGTGATTNVVDGVQFDAGTTTVRGTAVIGALRGGGFLNARIGSSDAWRSATGNRKVPALASGLPTTSAHLKLAGATFATTPGRAWGNGPNSTTPEPGPVVTLACGSCHNPHGNGNYRILRPEPNPPPGLTEPLAAPAIVPDGPTAAEDLAGATRNYTVIQTDASGTPIYLATDVAAVGNASAGDYWHQRVPWTSASRNDYDNPIGNADKTIFKTQITAWCSTCHTRYFQSGFGVDTGDAIYRYRHDTTSSRPCTTCHVAHGSNALMPGFDSQHVAYPDNIVGGVFNPVATTASSDSRLLKVDNRGTCQMCHDPTESGDPAAGTPPVPILP